MSYEKDMQKWIKNVRQISSCAILHNQEIIAKCDNILANDIDNVIDDDYIVDVTNIKDIRDKAIARIAYHEGLISEYYEALVASEYNVKNAKALAYDVDDTYLDIYNGNTTHEIVINKTNIVNHYLMVLCALLGNVVVTQKTRTRAKVNALLDKVVDIVDVVVDYAVPVHKVYRWIDVQVKELHFCGWYKFAM